ncbi:MAG: helix-turn-helix domain-containing protein [Candidatus Thiodiazotropha sp. (ex Dulcina madagascariensis)]|nr:helix-turn-helix domain-containing protein [Candidatus Thiodiazotropha sp. (ex Dulcina madagascariensis)]
MYPGSMKLRIGMNQQQYQRIEAGGNPRLETLELIAEGLEAELVLVPKDKVRAVKALLSEVGSDAVRDQGQAKADEGGA